MASPTERLQLLNLLPAEEAEEEFLKCCGSRGWAHRAIAQRPFADAEDLMAKSARVWWSLGSSDWLEAFHSHPKIGETKAAAPTAAEAQRWSEDEQSGIRHSARQTIEALADLNARYEEKFGYIF